MSILAYVSGHGLGHAAREIEILGRIPAEIPLIVKTLSPEWFWNEEVARPFERIAEGFDVGSVQRTSLDADVPATLDAWLAIDASNRARFETERAFIEQRGVRAIVGDITPFGFHLAETLGLPCFCPTNFTWVDIYGEYVAEEPRFRPIVEELARQYNLSTLLNTDLDLPMQYFTKREHVGLVARVGENRRKELLPHLPPDTVGKRLALVYAGNWGLPLAWHRLQTFENWHFITLTPPKEAVTNLSALPRTILPHQDIVSSVDLVVSKPGYGLVGECLAAGTPLLYAPRTGFAEYQAMDAALSAWDGGHRLPFDAFTQVEWEPVLTHIEEHGRASARPAPGGQNAADRIARAWKTGV